MLKQDELLFLIVWLVNFLFAVLYLVRKHENPESKTLFRIQSVIMILFPVAGPLFFIGSHLVHKAVFHKEADLTDVIFSKERVKIYLKADEERERNLVPLEEALAVSDKKNLRALVLNIIQGDLKDSLEAIMLTLHSEDSEASHYTASVLREELNHFRANVYRLQMEINQEALNETTCEELLLDYMNKVLKQQIFTEIEQKQFIKILTETAEQLYQKDKTRLSPSRYEELCLLLLKQNWFEQMQKWYLRLKRQYPKELPSYTCGLKLYFKLNDRQNFFAVMDELRQSDIVIDSDTLEAFRTFSPM